MAGEMRQLEQTDIGRAIKAGDYNTLLQLVKHTEAATHKDRKGNTYLHLVCTMYRPYVFNLLAASGIDVNAQNRDGNTALHVTALHSECCHVPDLLAVGTNPNIKNKYGKLAADIANKNPRWMDLYNKYYPGLREAVRQHDVEKVEYLLHCWSATHIVVNGKDMRQYAASLTFHDLVALIDKYRFSVSALYAIKEGDYKALQYCLSRGMAICNVNLLQTLTGSHPHHMLQHAIRRHDVTMVDCLCTAGADVNTQVHVKEYFQGPLFFEAFEFTKNRDDLSIIKRLLQSADLSSKDERGRSALIYAIDQRNDNVRNGKVTLELVDYLLKLGADISQRDVTGCTARNIAMFARRSDIVRAIDKHMIQIVKNNDVDGMFHLVEMGYDNLFIEFDYRDTWIYAVGNDTDEMLRILDPLPDFVNATMRAHDAVERGDLEAIKHEAHIYTPCMLLTVKDKGGRSPLMKAILYGHMNIVYWLMKTVPGLAARDSDLLGRTILHYVYATENTDLLPIFSTKTKESKKDCLGVLPREMQEKNPDFVEIQHQATYGLETEGHCIEIYEDLLKIIRSNRRGYKEFMEKLKELRYPVAKFPTLFRPGGNPLVCDYRDLLLCSIDQGKLDIAKKLVRLGTDCTIVEKYDGEGEEVWMDAKDRAQHLGFEELVDYIDIHSWQIENDKYIPK